MLKISDDEKQRIMEMHSLRPVLVEQDAHLDKNYVQPLINKGFEVVDKISLPDGPYILVGSGYLFLLNDVRGGWTNYNVVTMDGVRSGKEISVMLKSGHLTDFVTKPYKILYRAPGKF